MNVYKEMYLKLFNALTPAIELLQNAQVEAERAFTHAKDGELDNDGDENVSEGGNAG